MAKSSNPIPPGFHTVNPSLVVHGAAAAIDFYKKAFGAVENVRMPMPGSDLVMHAEIQIGDSKILLSDEMPGMGGRSPIALGGSPVTMHLYVADVDATYQSAIAAGAKPTMPPTDQFWGDRYGRLIDPFGHSWSLATHTEDLTGAEMDQRAKAMFAEMGAQKS
jgi:uncharacterized glyoxalase superfamily protein PhnB